MTLACWTSCVLLWQVRYLMQITGALDWEFQGALAARINRKSDSAGRSFTFLLTVNFSNQWKLLTGEACKVQALEALAIATTVVWFDAAAAVAA